MQFAKLKPTSRKGLVKCKCSHCVHLGDHKSDILQSSAPNFTFPHHVSALVAFHVVFTGSDACSYGMLTKILLTLNSTNSSSLHFCTPSSAFSSGLFSGASRRFSSALPVADEFMTSWCKITYSLGMRRIIHCSRSFRQPMCFKTC